MTFQAPADLAEAERLLAAREYERAHGLCLAHLRRDPAAPDAWRMLGVIAADHGNHEKALELFERAASLAPGDPRPPALRARSLTTLGRRDGALAAAEAAVSLSPRDAFTLDTLGVVFSRLGLHGRAVGVFERAAAAGREQADRLYNLGASRQFSGDFAGAEAAYARAVALEPGLHRAWSARVSLARQTPEANHAAQLEALFIQAGEDADARLHLGHALAKTFEDLGEPSLALDWLHRAKAAKRAAVAHDPARDAALFAAAADTFRPGEAAGGDPSPAPVFIVGLPRTGTTLVDRILSSHPQVVSAGELTNFALIAKQMAATPGALVLDPPTLAAARGIDFAALGGAYLESVAPLRGASPRFIDKMPLNLFYAGLVHRALPNARIVCLRRDPMDACLANYRQLFATGFSYYDYAYDLAHTAAYYAGFEGLAARWRAVLPPDRYTEVAYEAVVADLEGEARRLVGFLGLDWDPACLAFHENAAPVATASSVQVRQPLYSSSIGRWRRYGEGLAPLRAALEAQGVAVAD